MVLTHGTDIEYDSAVLSPHPQEISTSVLLINANFSTHQGSTSTTIAMLILGNHVQPESQTGDEGRNIKQEHLQDDEEEYLTLLERVLLKGCLAEAAAAVFLAAALTSETPVLR